MAKFKCKKCGETNPVLEEWITLGVNRIVICDSCGHKMNLNLSQGEKPESTASLSDETEKGTVITGINDNKKQNHKLVITSNTNEKNSTFLVKQGSSHKIHIGRNPESKIDNLDKNQDEIWIIEDPYISRAHCQIEVEVTSKQTRFIIEDKGSANGTMVNTNKLEKGDKILVNIGDEITIGDTVILLS